MNSGTLTMSTVGGSGCAQDQYVLLEDVRHTVAHTLLHPRHAERLAYSPNHCTKDAVSEFFSHGGVLI